MSDRFRNKRFMLIYPVIYNKKALLAYLREICNVEFKCLKAVHGKGVTMVLIWAWKYIDRRNTDFLKISGSNPRLLPGSDPDPPMRIRNPKEWENCINKMMNTADPSAAKLKIYDYTVLKNLPSHEGITLTTLEKTALRKQIIDELQHWHRTLLTMINDVPTKHVIEWIYEPTYNHSKIDLFKYVSGNRIAWIIRPSNPYFNPGEFITKARTLGWNEKCIFLDINSHACYEQIRTIKDGWITTDTYDINLKTFHVFVFANYLPSSTLLYPHEPVIWNIVNNRLVLRDLTIPISTSMVVPSLPPKKSTHIEPIMFEIGYPIPTEQLKSYSSGDRKL